MFFLLWPVAKVFLVGNIEDIESEREKYFRKRERCIVLLLQLLLAVGSFAASAAVRFFAVVPRRFKIQTTIRQKQQRTKTGQTNRRTKASMTVTESA